jgi:D-glycero-D-manno-heptose 1,7-bisphosphate phosphatase
MQPAVFFDRDGTLMEEVNYCGDPAKVRVIPGAAEALARLKQRGFANIIITNQSGIGRGMITREQFEAVQAALLSLLGEQTIDATYFCPDTPETATPRRKPSPEMVFEAQRDHDLDLTKSFFVGDRASDVECGHNAGVRTILVRTGYGSETTDCTPDFTSENVVAAVDLILKESNA